MSTVFAQTLKDAEWDLIADQVLGELDPIDAGVLDQVDPAARARATRALEHTAGALAAALAEERGDALPTLVVERVTQRCAQMRGEERDLGTPATALAADAGANRRSASVGGWRMLPWMIAAAACIAATVAIWPTGTVSPRTQLAMLRASATDAREATWADWSLSGEPPKVKGVEGEVVWSDSEQIGVLHFEGLPPCEAGKRYQLWIVDSARGFDQRISGAVFDGGPGEVYVPVKPKIPVHQAQAFAVTIERADGTWVSDMSQRVVIAMVR